MAAVLWLENPIRDVGVAPSPVEVGTRQVDTQVGKERNNK
jgi:hypothetical protein